MNKDNYTIEMKALCKAIEQEADALPLIQRLLEEKHISADDLKTMLRDDHNMVDASVVHQLVKAGVFTTEELVRDCHIDPGFVSMLGSTLVDMVEYNNNIQNIDNGNTEVYLWGIPSSGKTCALGALLCSLRNDKDVAIRMVPIPSAQGFGYMTQLEQVFPLNNAICKLPGRTPTKTNFAIGLELEDTMGKVHPVTLVDMAGELFCYLHWMAVGRAGEYDDYQDSPLRGGIWQGGKEIQGHVAGPVPHHRTDLLEEYRRATESHRWYLRARDEDRQDTRAPCAGRDTGTACETVY